MRSLLCFFGLWVAVVTTAHGDFFTEWITENFICLARCDTGPSSFYDAVPAHSLCMNWRVYSHRQSWHYSYECPCCPIVPRLNETAAMEAWLHRCSNNPSLPGACLIRGHCRGRDRNRCIATLQSYQNYTEPIDTSIFHGYELHQYGGYRIRVSWWNKLTPFFMY